MAVSKKSLLMICFTTWLIGVVGANLDCSNIQNVPQGFQSVSYSPSEEHLENPGRGFFRMIETRTSNFHPLTVHHLDSLRNSQGINNALRIYILDTFVDSPISSTILEGMRTDFQIARDAGFTLALRFHYTNHRESHAPYGDATKAVMLQHIEQIGPILSEYEGVISVIQAGFIGTYGEWYYTTHFGDPEYPITEQHWNDRGEILMALIHNSPASIQIQVRTPAIKMKLCHTTTAATMSDVEQNNCVGRTGHHNDCFVSSDNDVGTYHNASVEKPYLAADTKLMDISGETCKRSSDSHSDHNGRSDCPTALRELAEFHWSLLHAGYNPHVIDDWKTQGCFDEIHKRLGYRLSLKSVILPTQVQAVGDVCYQIVLENTGYSAPHKDWKVAIVLKSQGGNEYFAANLDNVDVRSWLPGNDITLSGTFKLSSDVQTGTYDVYLTIVDDKMKNYANYYILLANVGVPLYSEGLNSLKTTLDVTGSTSVSTTWTPPSRGRYSRVFGSSNPTTTPTTTTPTTTTAPTTASPQGSCTQVSVPDPSFENQDETAWRDYNGGFNYVTSEAQDGNTCISITDGGARHIFTFDPPITKYIMTAYSKMSGSVSDTASQYSIYCDLKTTDGSHVWGKIAPFQQSNPQWHKAILKVDEPQGIARATCYLMYRHFDSGTAYFDNVKMWIVPDSEDINACNV